METEKMVKLSSGYECPFIGIGTFQANDPEKLKAAIKTAISLGYRHIDTARYYSNEDVVGESIQQCFTTGIVNREEIFLTTKLAPAFSSRSKVVEALKDQLLQLETAYVDLYLVHFPVPLKCIDDNIVSFDAKGNVQLDFETSLEETWAGMEDCVKAGLARSIGLSNYNISQVGRILRCATIKPAVNQVESHPAFQNNKLIDFCQKSGIVVTAYSQFGSPATLAENPEDPMSGVKLLEDETLVSIGKKYGKSAAQVILRWQIQRNVLVIPKSTTPSKIAENVNIWDFQLTDSDMETLAKMDRNKRFFWLDFPGLHNHPEYPFSEAGSC